MSTDPPRYRDQRGQLIGEWTVAELTDRIAAAGVPRPIAEAEAVRRLGGHPSESVTGDSGLGSLPSGARESLHMQAADELVMAMGGRVYRLSQSRPTKQSLGLPDRLYVLAGKGKWYTWEAKAEWGRLSEAQRVFAEEAGELGLPHVVGGVRAMQRRLVEDGLCVVCGDGRVLPRERGHE